MSGAESIGYLKKTPLRLVSGVEPFRGWGLARETKKDNNQYSFLTVLRSYVLTVLPDSEPDILNRSSIRQVHALIVRMMPQVGMQ